MKNEYLAIIPARKGSKRLKNKNLKKLGNLPLVSWTIEAAKNSKKLSKIIVSTDSCEIAELARSSDVCVPGLRPEKLATDHSNLFDVVGDIVSKEGEFQNIVLLQPTSPFRNSDDIDCAIDVFEQSEGHSVVSVSKLAHPIEWSGYLGDNGEMDEFYAKELINKQSQNLKTSYRINGAIYIADIVKLKAQGSFVFETGTYAYEMPELRSIDIDEEADLLFAEFLLSKIGLVGP